jgi:hypothetical protein
MGQMSRKRDYDDAGLTADSVSSAKRNRQSPPRIGGLKINGHRRNGDGGLSSSISEDSTSSKSDSSSETSDGSASEDTISEDDEDETSSPDSSSSSSSSPSSSSLSADASSIHRIGEEDSGESSRADDDDSSEQNEDDNNDDEEEEEGVDAITFVTGKPKPQIQRLNEPGLLSRVSSFLPQLRAANEDLQRKVTTGRSQDVIMDDVDKDIPGQYIEMVRIVTVSLALFFQTYKERVVIPYTRGLTRVY